MTRAGAHRFTRIPKCNANGRYPHCTAIRKATIRKAQPTRGTVCIVVRLHSPKHRLCCARVAALRE